MGGGSASRDIEWMSAQKMNLVEAHASLSVDREGTGHAVLSQAMIENGRLHGLKVVPIIMHLDQVFDTGILEGFQGAAGRKDLDSHGGEFAAEIDDTGFVGNGNESPLDDRIRHVKSIYLELCGRT